MARPANAIAAVTHPDPYPYYAELVAERPLYRDAALGLWVASSAAAVETVLTSGLCRVRPLAEPIPRALLGSPAAAVFGSLVRMTDGPGQAAAKQAVAATVTSLDVRRVVHEGRRWAEVLADEIEPAAHVDRLPDFMFRLPVYVLASLLGVARERLRETSLQVGDFARCVAPGGTPEQIERGKTAAGGLLEVLGALAGHGVMADLRRRGAAADVVVANGIGLLFQAYESTAGLIGNTLLALARGAEGAGRLPYLLRDVLRHDPPVQNTRRFVARSGVVAGCDMQEGDAVLVVLAAASRDPAAASFTFGRGAHACPGDAIATAIAQSGIEYLLASGLALERLGGPTAYRPSANTRIPLFVSPDLPL
jgi:cytochrome P450